MTNEYIDWSATDAQGHKQDTLNTSVDQWNGLTEWQYPTLESNPIIPSVTPHPTNPINLQFLPRKRPLRLTLYITDLPPNYDTLSSYDKQVAEWLRGLHVYQIASSNPSEANYDYEWIGRLPYGSTPTFTTLSNYPVAQYITNGLQFTLQYPLINNQVVIRRSHTEPTPELLFASFPKYIQLLNDAYSFPSSNSTQIETINSALVNDALPFPIWFDRNKSSLLSSLILSPTLTSLREQVGADSYFAESDLFPDFFSSIRFPRLTWDSYPYLHYLTEDKAYIYDTSRRLSNIAANGHIFFNIRVYTQDQVNYEYLSRRYAETDNNSDVSYSLSNPPRPTVICSPTTTSTYPIYLYYNFDIEDLHPAGVVYPHHN